MQKTTNYKITIDICVQLNYNTLQTAGNVNPQYGLFAANINTRTKVMVEKINKDA